MRCRVSGGWCKLSGPLVWIVCFLIAPALAAGADAVSFDAIATEFGSRIKPLLKQFCLDCHSTDQKEGELDLERFATLKEVRRNPQVWKKVAEQLDNREMPPEDSPPLSAGQQKRLRGWIRRYLNAEARAGEGDPGPVVLRRLNNAEYTYTVQDLTRVLLKPAREFPADGAAGEGFTNIGNALAMSPALVRKYLNAGKQVASHAVLLPDRFRFSPSRTRRDWANEILTQIRLIYARHTSGESDTSILNRWSADPNTSTANDGRVDLTRYFAVLIAHRQRLLGNLETVDAIATEEKLNAKYLRHLATMLVSGEPKTLLLELVRQRWRTVAPADAAVLAAEIRAWQNQLWKFNSVGHLGIIRRWQTPANPLPASITLKQPMKIDDRQNNLVLFLVAKDTGDSRDEASVIWEKPRIEFKGRPPILLRDVRSLSQRVGDLMTLELGRTDRYLMAVAQLSSSSQPIEQLAKERRLNPRLLESWTEYLRLGNRVSRTIAGHFSKKLTKVHGYEAVNGWGAGDLPSVLTNRSKQPISFLTLTVPPRGVTVHPTPDKAAAIGWRSPIAGKVRIEGKVADADDKCGNGAAWRLELLTASGTAVLASGVIDNGRDSSFRPTATFDVRKGDVITLVVGARDRSHACDTTHVELKIRQQGNNRHVWDLAADVVDKIQSGNPLPDKFGHAEIWHFFTRGDKPKPGVVVPPSSSLARWRAAAADSKSKEELARLATSVRDVLTATSEKTLLDPDKSLRRQLHDWIGPLQWVIVAGNAKNAGPVPSSVKNGTFGLDPAKFGRKSEKQTIDSASLLVKGPHVLEIRLPTALIKGGEFVVEAKLAPDAGGNGSVQVQLLTKKPAAQGGPFLQTPILTRNGSQARTRLLKAYADFRRLFPAAMCHARIVPVDEVVTLILYHREDDHFMRLMLDDAQKKQLDRLWDELHFVSRDALRLEVALEQILEFSTQDADPSKFDPVLKPIAEGAKSYRRQLVEAEESHLDALVEFAARAYRRPLSKREERRLDGLYRTLRAQELPHDEAFRITLARVLSAPAFLYRLEKPGAGALRTQVSDWELASRLSYFLWSSLPDAELRRQAAVGKLTDAKTLVAETRRMLRDARVRRLAIEFACQWLQIRDFDRLDEKSERHFPQFAALRGDMYEESIRFFADLFRRDGSILEILDADHTFLNESLAKHYGIPGVTGKQWRRVDGVKRFSRGGILTHSTTLAKQSGASRTSPILRGNWVADILLGERLPRPPKNVPQLPDDESASGGLTIRQIVEKHSSVASCAKCHVRIDPYGFSLERFDAIGRFRDKDLGGRPIDTQTQLMDGTKLKGLEGLRRYLLTPRREAFVRQFCRKLLGYSLGRGLQLSDEPLLDKMMLRLKEKDYRFSVAVETIVLSEPFRMIRGSEFGAKR